MFFSERGALSRGAKRGNPVGNLSHIFGGGSYSMGVYSMGAISIYYGIPKSARSVVYYATQITGNSRLRKVATIL